MKRKLPPLNSLKSFEAAARHLSFTNAAYELCVTQGAVSKQIKTLEEYLGVDVFKRTSIGLILTKQGEDYFRNLHEVFNNIESATEHIFGNVEVDSRLTINILPSLSTNWLIPHIQGFKEKNSTIDVCIHIGDGNDFDFDALNADVAIRVADAPIEGVHNELLFHEKMLLVCSPSLINESDFEIEDVNNYNLLGHTGRPYMWNRCMESLGVKNKDKSDIISFEHFFMMSKAAKESIGFALVPDIVVNDDIAKGKLINPLGITYETEFSYYLVCPKQKAKLDKIISFSIWIKDISKEMH